MRPSAFSRLALALPLAWMALFLVLPFLIVLFVSFSTKQIGTPPFAPAIAIGADGLRFAPDLGNYAYLFGDALYVLSYLSALKIAAISTVAALLIGYPVAYAIVRAPARWRPTLLTLVVLPFWTSFLIRVYAWIGILSPTGILNNALIGAGVIGEPLVLLNTEAAVVLGIVYSYLPFVILPLYATLERLDGSLLEAAADLGCRPVAAFLRVTLPLSVPGIVAGGLLIFIPAVGEFVIPDLLGGTETLMIGKVLWDEFFGNADWPVAAAVAMALLVLLIGPILWLQRTQEARS